MTVSDISQVLLAYAQESTFGQQVTGCNLQKVRLTGESLKQDTDIANSNEIRPDRQIVGVSRTRVAVSGGLDFELSYGSFDDFLACVLMSANVKAQGLLTLDTNCTGGNSSQGLLSLDVNPIDGDTMTIGTTVYRFKTIMTQANDIQIGTTAVITQASVVATINGTGTAGMEYYTATVTPHPLVRMGAFAANDSIVTAIATGVAGDAIPTTETFDSDLNIFDAVTLGTEAAGADGDTMTIDTKVYYFDMNGALDNIDGHIEVGAATANTQASIVEAFVLGGTPGTGYAALMTAHPTVTIAAFATDIAVLTAMLPGLVGNAIATTETFAAGTNEFDAATLGTTTAGAGWTAPVTVTASTISVASGDSSFNDSGNGFGSIVANQWIRASGFTAAADNGYFKVASATAAKVIVYATLVTEAEGASRTIKQGSSIVNGVAKNSFNFERTYTDLTQELALFKGCMLNQMTLTVGTNGIITGSFGVMGQIETSETASGGDGYEDPNDNDVLNSIDHVQGVYENAAAIDVLDCSLTINNNLRERLKVGTLGPFGFGANSINVSGSFTAYYESKTLYDKYLDFDNTSLAKVFQDADGNGYVFDMPGLKITDGQRHSGAGIGDDFKVPCTFQAFMEGTEEITIRIVRFAA